MFCFPAPSPIQELLAAKHVNKQRPAHLETNCQFDNAISLDQKNTKKKDESTDKKKKQTKQNHCADSREHSINFLTISERDVQSVFATYSPALAMCECIELPAALASSISHPCPTSHSGSTESTHGPSSLWQPGRAASPTQAADTPSQAAHFLHPLHQVPRPVSLASRGGELPQVRARTRVRKESTINLRHEPPAKRQV